MNIRPIHTEEDYRAALKNVSALFDNEPVPGTPEGDYFEVLITLIEAYEAKHFPLDLPLDRYTQCAQRLATRCAPNSK